MRVEVEDSTALKLSGILPVVLHACTVKAIFCKNTIPTVVCDVVERLITFATAPRSWIVFVATLISATPVGIPPIN